MNLCRYEHPISVCGAENDKERLTCKYFFPGNGDVHCSYYSEIDGRCGNHYANFECYADIAKWEESDG